MELLFHLKDKGSLPNISDQLGNYVRTNSESLIGVRVPGSQEDLSKGVAIGSGVYIDEHTHIEAVRYPEGSDTMSMLTTILTGGRPGPGRVALWMRNLIVSLLLHPFRTVAIPAAIPLGAGMRDPALHASAGRPHRHAMGAACVLAISKIPGEPRSQGADLHSRSQRVCREVRAALPAEPR